MDLYNILIVDSERANLNALEKAFRHEYSFFTATNGKDALAIMRQNDIALIITDHPMYGMTGIELLEEVLEKYPDTFRILLTANTDEEVLMDAINKGHVHRFIAKPWETEEIKAAVKEGLEAYEINRLGRELYNRNSLEEQSGKAAQARREEKKTIWDILVDRRMITREQLETAMKLQESDQKKLGDVLIEIGAISHNDLEMAHGLQRHKIKRLAEILTDLGYADEESIYSCYALQLGMPYISLSQFPSSPRLTEILPARLAYKYTIVPVNLVGRVFVVAALEPLSDKIKSEIEAEIGYKVMAVCTSRRDMENALKERYPV